MDAVAFQALADAAGGADNIAAYCKDVTAGSAGANGKGQASPPSVSAPPTSVSPPSRGPRRTRARPSAPALEGTDRPAPNHHRLTRPTPALAAASLTEVIVLPGASSAEGIAAGRGATFFAGDLFDGHIFRGDLQRGTAELFITVPENERMAVGMAADVAHDLLFVAGGFKGQGYIYNTRSGATVATYQFGDPATTAVNDVALTNDGAWFTDSLQPQLYFVPVSQAGVPETTFRTLALSGPAAAISPLPDLPNLNGIRATPDGRTLIVAHTANAQLHTVDPTTGASATIAGISLPFVDGLVLEAGRLLAVQNLSNQISRIRLAPDLSSGVVEEVITDDLFQAPTTAARFGSPLAVINAKIDTGLPPQADQYEVIVVDR